jgi:hypothetical protein
MVTTSRARLVDSLSLKAKMNITTVEQEQARTANPLPAPSLLGMHPGMRKEIVDLIDPAAEEAYWRENYSSRPYVTRGTAFNEYRTAYRYGVDAYALHEGRSFEQAEPELTPGDSDHDGK